MTTKNNSKKSIRYSIVLSIWIVLLVVVFICTKMLLFSGDNNQNIIEQNEETLVKENEETPVHKSNETTVDEGNETIVDESKITTVDQDNKNVVDDVAFYEIETKYCKLYFPEIWNEQIVVRYTEGAGYKAEFYGLVEGKSEQHLFDVCFNSDDGNLLGYLENVDEIVNISIDVMDLKFDNTWKQEEIDQIYAMQEEMNYVMNSLSKNENYVEP